MKKVTFSVGLLLFALGIFFVPVSFSVKGFGMIVSPDGVRSVRTLSGGTVFQAEPSVDGLFSPGDILSVVMSSEAAATNAFARQTLQATLVEIAAKQGERISDLTGKIARAEAKLDALDSRLASAETRAARIEELEAEITAYRDVTRNELDQLADERLSEIAKLEDLLNLSGERSAMPEQRRLQLMQQVFSDRTATLRGRASGYSTDQLSLNLSKEKEQIAFDTHVNTAERKILVQEIADMAARKTQIETLRDNMIHEARARYLAGLSLPEVNTARGVTRDLRVVQGNRATVARGDVVRIVEQNANAEGLYLTSFGKAETIDIVLRSGDAEHLIPLSAALPQTSTHFEALGWEIGAVRQDRWVGQALSVFSFYLPLQAGDGAQSFEIIRVVAAAADGTPVPVEFSLVTKAHGAGSVDGRSTSENVILGFVDNGQALVMEPGQQVTGSLRDPRDSFATVLEGEVVAVSHSTIDSTELAQRLGNQAVAKQILTGSVLSQLSIRIGSDDAAALNGARGAVVKLAFPIRTASVFTYLSSGHAW